jgi:hypothetical protein
MRLSAPAHHACLTTGPPGPVRQAGPRVSPVRSLATRDGRGALSLGTDRQLFTATRLSRAIPRIPLVMKNQQARGWPQAERRQAT